MDTFHNTQFLLAAIIESSNDAIFMRTTDGIIKTWNKGAENLFGYSTEEIIGMHISILFPPEKKESGNDLINKINQGDLITNYETVRLRKDGSRVPVSLTISLVKNDEKEILGVSVIARDITNQKKTEQKLRDSEERIRKFLDSVQIGVFVLDKNGTAFYANKRSFEILGKGVFPQTHPSNYPELYQLYSEETNTIYDADKLPIYRALLGESSSKEDIIIRHTDRDVIIKTWGTPIFDENGEIEYAVATFEDITERKQKEAEVKESQNFLNSIIEMIPQMIFVKEAKELRFVRFNKAGEELLGFKKEEMIGKNDYDFFPEEQAEFFIAKDRDVLKSGQILNISEEPINTRFKGKRFLQTTKTVIYDDKGAPKYLLGISIDITERKQLEEIKESLLINLEKKNKELNEFSHIVSHDLKAPLRAIGAISMWITQDYSDKIDEEGRDQLKLLAGRVQRMNEMIEAILQYSRAGRSAFQKESISLRPMLEELTNVLKSNTKFDTKVELELPVSQIDSDKIKLEQIFQNLIGNAIKYMDKEGGIVKVGFTDKGACYQFYVTDNGPGIEKQYHEKIFQIFQTINPDENNESSGVGLAIVKKIVESMNGKVWIESTPGMGSTFFFTILKE